MTNILKLDEESSVLMQYLAQIGYYVVVGAVSKNPAMKKEAASGAAEVVAQVVSQYKPADLNRLAQAFIQAMEGK